MTAYNMLICLLFFSPTSHSNDFNKHEKSVLIIIFLAKYVSQENTPKIDDNAIMPKINCADFTMPGMLSYKTFCHFALLCLFLGLMILQNKNMRLVKEALIETFRRVIIRNEHLYVY